MNDIETIMKIAEEKLAEAEMLYAGGGCAGVIYFAGYVIELCLKARIAYVLEYDALFDPQSGEERESIRPFKIHDLERLLLYAGLKTRYLTEKGADFQLEKGRQYIIDNWSEQLRYCKPGRFSQTDALTFINHVKYIKSWITKDF